MLAVPTETARRAMQAFLVRIIAILVLLGPAGGWLAGCEAPSRKQPSAAEHVAAVEAYRQERIASLKQPDSWLALAGLYWLDDGRNTFGSDSANDIVFPASAPARLGTFTLDDGRVRVEAAPDVSVTHDGTPVDTLTLASDAAAEPTVLQHGTLSWYVIDREGRLGLRLKDSAHPALAAFEGIDTYPIDLGWRLTGRFEPYEPPRTLRIPNIVGMVTEQTGPGAVAFGVGGQTYRLDVTGEPGDSTFFIMFSDPTNGEATYEGGRYLWIDAPDDDGTVVIDFNKAYNPPCVFTPYATCPLPPPQNRLPIRVEAGEKKYGEGVH